MRRVGKGGYAVFTPTIRPNTFSPIGVEDVIDRHGEKALWFRMQPCPCPAEKRTPDCAVCVDGYVKTFQETSLVELERCKHDGHLLFPRYAPVRRVVKAEWFKTQPVELSVKRLNADNSVEIGELLKYWHAVDLTYEVGLVEEETVEAEAIGDHRVTMPVAGVIVAVMEAYLVTEAGPEPIQPVGVTFDALVFDRRIFGRIRARLKVFPPIRVAYRVLGIDQEKTEPVRIKAETGDLDIIVPQNIMMGEGDIITFLSSEFRTSQYVPFRSDPKDPNRDDLLSYSPIVSVINIFSKEKRASGEEYLKEYAEGQDFIVLSSERIRWLTPKPQGGYTIMYVYHPSFRVQAHVESGGNMDRRLPRQYRAKACSSYNIRG